MSYVVSDPSDNKVKINWAKECFVGAILSAIFTLMAVHAGEKGVVSGGLAAHLREFMIIGGTAMGAICGITGVVLIVLDVIEFLMCKLRAMPGDVFGILSSVGRIQTVKLKKIS